MSEIALDQGALSGSNFDAEVNAPSDVANAQPFPAESDNASLPASVEKVGFREIHRSACGKKRRSRSYWALGAFVLRLLLYVDLSPRVSRGLPRNDGK